MIKAGTWTGFYSFSNTQLNEMRGFEKTNFKIRIETIDGNMFTGKVEDDLFTGGTEGIGTIKGQVNGTVVKFVKQMPVKTIIFPDGTLKTFAKKHRPIHYTGQFADDGETINGIWKIKPGISWSGSVPFLTKGNGTWSMCFDEQ